MAVKQKQSIRVREIEAFISKFSGENFLGIIDSKPYSLVQKIKENFGNIQVIDTSSANELLNHLDDEDFEAEDDFSLKCFVGLNDFIKTVQDDKENIQRAWALAKWLQNRATDKKPALFIDIELDIPLALKAYFKRLIEKDLIVSQIEEIIDEYAIEFKHPIDDKHALAFELLGLSHNEVEEVLKDILLIDTKLIDFYVIKVRSYKKELLNKNPILEAVIPKFEASDLIGYDRIKSYLKKVKKQIDNPKMNSPKGILIGGYPGCGKSMFAHVFAKELDLPFVKLDIGKILGKYVGESEKNLDEVFHTLKSAGNVVLWIDEIEKAFAGMEGSGSEVTRRLAGKLLTWMQENGDNGFSAYIVASANNISELPAELFRAGRLDERFFIGLPNYTERKSFFETKYSLFENKLTEKDYNYLALKTNNYSGSDLNQMFNSCKDKFYNNSSSNPLLLKEVLTCLLDAPYKEQNKEQFEKLDKQWKGKNFSISSSFSSNDFFELKKQGDKLAFEYCNGFRKTKDYNALMYLAICYHFGYGTNEDTSKRDDYYNKVIKVKKGKEIFDAYIALKEYLKNIKQINWVFKLLKDSADLDYHDAIYTYSHRFSWKTNSKERLEWLTKAADKGHLNAQLELGSYYYVAFEKFPNPEEKKSDGKTALKWFIKASENQKKSDISDMGFIYKHIGELYKFEELKNEQKSFDNFQKGAELNHDGCLIALGEIYYNGNSIQIKDKSRGLECFIKAEYLGNLNANYLIGRHYLYFAAEEHKHLCEKYLLKGAVKNNIGCQNLLGEFYNSINKYEDAFKWFEKAAHSLKSPHALCKLAVYYRFGKGIKENKKLAFQFFETAAQQDVSMAYIYLSDCYWYGLGTPVKKDVATKYAEKAIKLGLTEMGNSLLAKYEYFKENPDYVKIKSYLKKAGKDSWDLVPDLVPVGYYFLWGKVFENEGNHIEANKYYEQGIKKDPEKSHNYYGLAINTKAGRGCSRDLNKALSLFEKAKDSGHKQAKAEWEKLTK